MKVAIPPVNTDLYMRYELFETMNIHYSCPLGGDTMSCIPEAAYYSEMLVSLPHSGKHRGMGFKICGGVVNQITKEYGLSTHHPLP